MSGPTHNYTTNFAVPRLIHIHQKQNYSSSPPFYTKPGVYNNKPPLPMIKSIQPSATATTKKLKHLPSPFLSSVGGGPRINSAPQLWQKENSARENTSDAKEPARASLFSPRLRSAHTCARTVKEKLSYEGEG